MMSGASSHVLAIFTTLAVGLLALTVCIDAKKVEGELTLDSATTEQYISKFSFSSGATGKIDGDFLVSRAYLEQRPAWLLRSRQIRFQSLQVAVYNQEAWDRYHTMIKEGSLCVERIQAATFQTLVPMSVPRNKGGEADVPFELGHEITPEENSHYWYIITADCSLEEYDAHPPTMQFQIEFFNGGSHLPADEDGMFTSQMLVLLLYVGLIAAYCFFTFRQYSEKGQVHLAVVLLGVAIVLQTLALIMELMHLFVFNRNGLGLRWRHSWFPADFFSEITQDMSELLSAMVLIALSFGWTIPDPDLVMNPMSRNSFLSSIARPADWVKKITPATVFVVALVVSNVVLELLGRGFEDDFNQFHDHEHWPGYTLMLIRVGLAVLFAFGIVRSRASEAAASTMEVSKFYLQLGLSGICWFVAFPLCVYCAGFVEPHKRHRLVTIGAIVTQAFALCYLLSLFLFKSTYFKISSLQRMGGLSQMGIQRGKICID